MSDEGELLAAVADLRSGTVVRFLSASGHDVLERFAAVVPELYAADRGAWAYGAFERAHLGSAAAHLDDLVLVAPPSVHVALRLSEDGRVLLAVGAWRENVGAVVAAARAHRAALEETP